MLNSPRDQGHNFQLTEAGEERRLEMRPVGNITTIAIRAKGYPIL
jgi:hypothetical protein